MDMYCERMRLLTTTSGSLSRVLILPLHVITLPKVVFTTIQFASGVCWLVLLMSVVFVASLALPYNFDTQSAGFMVLGPFIENVSGSIYGSPFADWAVLRLPKRN
ncbi:hypothetical protein CH063_01278, partial [Colletotrichum higginsianum]